MDFQMMQQLFTQGGISFVVGYVAYKAISKLYTDMREDNNKREDALMAHLDKVADTLERIDKRIESMDNRIQRLESSADKEAT